MNTLPALFPGAFPGFGEAAPGALPPLTQKTDQQVRDLLVSPDFDAWSEALASVGNCARPIRLRGRSDTIDTATGEIVSSYSSEDEPLGLTHVRCGNRRASECPSCSRLYEADMFHLIRSGVTGGKTVPASVADNPLVFATHHRAVVRTPFTATATGADPASPTGAAPSVANTGGLPDA